MRFHPVKKRRPPEVSRDILIPDIVMSIENPTDKADLFGK